MVALLLACSDPPLPAVDVSAEAESRASEPARSVLPAHTVYPNVAEALAPIVARKPRILGVGELHATTDGPTIESTIARFTRSFLPVLAPNTSDLVLETWRLDGRCGATEEVVASTVQADTKRPEATKSELVLLAEAALAADVRPHDLALTCAEYGTLTGADGEIQYDTLLRLLTGKLQAFAVLGLDTPDAALVLYGGAVHNDLRPSAEMAAWSYGPAVAAKGGASYVELDLYVPELISDTLLEPEWAPLLAVTGPDRVVVYERPEGDTGARSFVMLLETTPPPR